MSNPSKNVLVRFTTLYLNPSFNESVYDAFTKDIL